MSIKSTTIQTLTEYQIDQLKSMFERYVVERIGILHETGELVLQYRGLDFHTDIGTVKTRKIPLWPDKNVAESADMEDAEFEVVQPKQLTSMQDDETTHG